VSALIPAIPPLTQPALPARRQGSGPLLDPGWLFLLAGVVILAATVLIPAKDDLDEARFYLDRALLVERHRLLRLEKYVSYLDALSRNDEGTVMALAAMQLNQTPDGNVLLVPTGDGSIPSQSVFAQLEPSVLNLPTRQVERSILERWCMGGTPRLILTAIGAMFVLIGLLPPTIPSRTTITR
jgi:hypothetical protein